MASSDSAEIIETSGYNSRGLSRLEILQQQQLQQYHLQNPQSQQCEHNCVCIHNHHPLINYHHHSNLFPQSASSSPLPQQSTAQSPSQAIPFNPHNHFSNPHHHHHPAIQQQLHSHFQQPSQQQHDSNLIYNNSSTNSDSNQGNAHHVDSSQSGCSNMHYVPTANVSIASQNLNVPSLACDCGNNCQIQHHGLSLMARQQLLEQQGLQSGRSSRVVSCDENPSGTEDGSGMSSSGMMGGRRASKRNL